MFLLIFISDGKKSLANNPMVDSEKGKFFKIASNFSNGGNGNGNNSCSNIPEVNSKKKQQLKVKEQV